MKLRGMLAVVVGLLVMSMRSYGQGMNSWWVFPDSIAIDFSSGSPVVSNSGAHSLNPYALDNASCISDKNGQLLFYLSGKLSPSSDAWGEIYNANGIMVDSSNKLFYEITGSIDATKFIEAPSDSNLIYLIQYNQPAGQSIWNVPMGIRFSLIDRLLNNGSGAIVLKNQMIDHDSLFAWIGAVKHANGRDWWIVTHKFRTTGSNEFDTYLLDPNGITFQYSQNIGPAIICNCYGPILGESVFSNKGDMFLFVSAAGYSTLLDFDRCTGTFSNPRELNPENRHDQYLGPFFGSFSQNDSVIYLSNLDSLWSVQTYSPNIFQLIWNNNLNNLGAIYNHALAPDGKIYISQRTPGDTVFWKYLSCIQNPNNFGSSCNFQHNSLWLNGHGVRNSVPVLPNYSLGPLAGSPCDTLTSTHTIPAPNYSLSIAPNPASGSTTVFYNLSSGQEAVLRIYNNLGQLIETTKLHKGSNHYEIDISHYTAGLYYALIGNGEWNEGRKFVVAP